MPRLLPLMTLLVLGSVEVASCQRPVTVTPQEAVNSVRRGRGGAVEALLRQQRGSLTGDALDALADSLVNVALQHRFADQGAQAAITAAAALAVAGAEAGPGVRYARAFDNLERMYRESSLDRFRAGVLTLFPHMPNRVRALGFLAEVAASNEMPAREAVRVLYSDTGPAGVARLRRMHGAGTVVEPAARVLLSSIAREEGWQ